MNEGERKAVLLTLMKLSLDNIRLEARLNELAKQALPEEGAMAFANADSAEKGLSEEDHRKLMKSLEFILIPWGDDAVDLARSLLPQLLPEYDA